ncbi:MAG: hypothetical protein JWM88_306 [Verrucomicrobia bacterium]|nr:hypothetical protein [Verrucomicrobiota bacterium]
MSIRIGCGSWADPEYVGVLYPKGLPANQRLRCYAEQFERVEVNSTYYATPARKVAAGWAEQTPPGFIFDVKLHREFSQSPRKTAQGDLADRLLDSMQPLIEAKKLGAFLLTLAPFFDPERHALEELDGAVEKLRPHALAVELRHRAWVDDGALAATLAYFRSRGLAWVALDMPRVKAASLLPPIDEVTHPKLAYVRLHGRNPHYLEAKTAAERHDYEYQPEDLQEIAARVRKLAARAEDVHVSVNNHAHDFAPKAALALRRLLEPPAGGTGLRPVKVDSS